ncbi:monosaccharide ABC transporter ATP-binding protein (CUT2 family) [Haloactinopolyspora alba]|uniref:Monosaccharide ABC transporter ATP-binding protein (CUT2 family) n=1 Tax=Haloactinopolyspora alba TaxID=648780 RepID=A0A2P8E904_9ACTN|nr:sugar ABC transporter ATP-binding protein [Haloactinopolyspora alba]PSL05962.1 monosaccharide ABC transporter ATP-binding protein (CUT2 family) [Haloactinopolyspora alba]
MTSPDAVETGAGDAPPLLRMSGIVKHFGGVRALRGADLTVGAGEVHALLGENGAGKSTLMNVLSGVVRPDNGIIEIDGVSVDLSSPAAAQHAGVGMIHQELDLVPQASVMENLFLGREPRTRLGVLDRAAMREHATSLLREIGVDLAPTRSLSSLRVGEQQMVAIAKALSLDARILVMDEPTSALSDTEVERLFAMLPRLRARGVGVIFISHRMDEIAVIADRATVMRDGCDVGSFEVARTPPGEVIRLMVGQPIEQLFPDREPPGSTTRLRVHDLTVTPSTEGGRSEPQGVELTVCAGEVLGLAGLLGAGRTELLDALFGVAGQRMTGTVELDGEPVRLSDPRAAIAAGIGYVPEDRRASGLVMKESVGANIVLSALPALSRLGWRSRGNEREAVTSSVRDLQIKTATPDVAVGTLSGGNQQKVVFARHLLRQPRLLLLDEPTRGVDIGAKSEIYRLLARLAADGVAVIVASSEMPELLGVCDRIAVLRGGRIVSEFEAAQTSQEDLLAAASLEQDTTSAVEAG